MKAELQKKSSAKASGFMRHKIKRWFLFSAFLIIAGFASMSVLGDNGILGMLKLQKLQNDLQKEIDELNFQSEELNAEIKRLQDSRYIEFVARDRLGLMRPNEVFLVLDRSGTSSSIDKP